ncbi:MAG TPA: hypothetical protein VMH79_15755 [Thermoanaerobaculia bacterium]|nr:hypothetical protein [Thermoanaerobaculia bacterium]
MVPDLRQFFEELGGRVTGPMKFRLLLQPVMAAFFAIRAGARDAREGRRPFLAAILAEPERRRERVAEGWRHVGRIFLLAMAMDLVYQVLIVKAFRPLESVVVSVVVALVPYLIFRGVVNRILSRRRGPAGPAI